MTKFLLFFAGLLLMTSCVPNVAVSNDYLAKKSKVGIYLTVNEPNKFKEGSQGLLDMAVTSGGKYEEALKLVSEKIQPKDQILKLYTDILQSKGKEVVVLNEVFNSKTAKKFEGIKEKDKKYATYDFTNLKSKYSVDEVLFINFNYGFLISYYGMIETGKFGFANYQPQIINLSDNSLIYAGSNVGQKPIKKWKDNNYAESVNAIQQAVNDALAIDAEKLK